MPELSSRSSISSTLNEKTTDESKTLASSASSTVGLISDDEKRANQKVPETTAPDAQTKKSKVKAKPIETAAEYGANRIPWKWGQNIVWDGPVFDEIIRPCEYQVITPASFRTITIGEGAHAYVLYFEHEPDATGGIFTAAGNMLVSLIKWPFRTSTQGVLICRRLGVAEESYDRQIDGLPVNLIIKKQPIQNNDTNDKTVAAVNAKGEKQYKLDYWLGLPAGDLEHNIQAVLSTLRTLQTTSLHLAETCTAHVLELEVLSTYRRTSHLTASARDTYAQQTDRVHLAAAEQNSARTAYRAAWRAAKVAVAAYFAHTDAVLAWLVAPACTARETAKYRRDLDAFTMLWYKQCVGGVVAGDDSGMEECVRVMKGYLLDRKKFVKEFGDVRGVVAAAAAASEGGIGVGTVVDEKAAEAA